MLDVLVAVMISRFACIYNFKASSTLMRTMLAELREKEWQSCTADDLSTGCLLAGCILPLTWRSDKLAPLLFWIQELLYRCYWLPCFFGSANLHVQSRLRPALPGRHVHGSLDAGCRGMLSYSCAYFLSRKVRILKKHMRHPCAYFMSARACFCRLRHFFCDNLGFLWISGNDDSSSAPLVYYHQTILAGGGWR